MRKSLRLEFMIICWCKWSLWDRHSIHSLSVQIVVPGPSWIKGIHWDCVFWILLYMNENSEIGSPMCQWSIRDYELIQFLFIQIMYQWTLGDFNLIDFFSSIEGVQGIIEIRSLYKIKFYEILNIDGDYILIDKSFFHLYIYIYQQYVSNLYENIYIYIYIFNEMIWLDKLIIWRVSRRPLWINDYWIRYISIDPQE